MRHLAVAYRDVSSAEPADPVADEHDLVFLGFVALSDPLRPGTADTIAQAGQLGVAVKVLTGDSAEVAGYVAGQVGLVSKDAPVLTGDDLAKLPEDGLAAAAQHSNVFARVSPDQKYALISAFKRTEVVGYQGDGINDAPSLKLAEVGIAVDTATDVAKASADIILLSPGLAVVINGIRSGRAIFANINKYVVYTMVGNFGNFLALSLLYLLATALPLLPRQLLLISLLTDVPLVAISTDSVISDELARPSKYDARSLLSTSLVLGVLTAIAELIFFASLHGQRPVSKETSLYLFLSFTQLVVIFSVRNRDHFWKANRMSTPLAAAMAVTAGVTLAIPYTHGVGHFFGFHPPSAAQVGAVLFGSAVYLFVLDAVKVAFYRIRSRRFDVRRRSSAPVQHAATGAH
jgi:Mg2+-importing ATPase